MESITELAEQLRRVRHFANLPMADLQAIVAAGCVHRYPAGTIICAESEPCAGMFVLLAGQVHLTKIGPQGQQPIHRREHSISEEMAARIATVLEAISRSLNTFKSDSYITCTRSTIVITRPQVLAQLAQMPPPLWES